MKLLNYDCTYTRPTRNVLPEALRTAKTKNLRKVARAYQKLFRSKISKQNVRACGDGARAGEGAGPVKRCVMSKAVYLGQTIR